MVKRHVGLQHAVNMYLPPFLPIGGQAHYDVDIELSDAMSFRGLRLRRGFDAKLASGFGLESKPSGPPRALVHGFCYLLCRVLGALGAGETADPTHVVSKTN